MITLPSSALYAALWMLLAVGLVALYYWKHQYVVRAAVWLRKLVEEDGEPSLRRAAFAFSLIAVVAVLGLACAWPEIITEQMVKAIEQVFLFVGGIYAVRGAIEDVTDLIKGRKE